MAASVNKVMIIGNLGRDPEVRTMASGGKVVTLNVATSESWKDRDGNMQDRTEWHRVVIFNERLTDVAERFLHKGSKVYLEGQLQTRKWQDQSGAERYTTEVVLPRFRGELTLLDRREAGGAGGGAATGGEDQYHNYGGGQYGQDSQNNQNTARRTENAAQSSRSHVDLDDDIPF